MSNDAAIRNIWKTAIVRKALSCDFVMRALLAVSATHMAAYRPDQKHHYLSHGIAYHDIASRKAITLMGEMRTEDLEDLWIFSVLTMYFGKRAFSLLKDFQSSAQKFRGRLTLVAALGSPRDDRTPLTMGDNLLPEWLFLFNGVHQILFALQSTSYAGIVSPITKHGSERWEIAHLPEHKNANILHDLSAKIDSNTEVGEERDIYHFAISELRCQLSFVLSPSARDLDITDAFVWHFAMAETFMPLLRRGKQQAVVIFAHSLITFHAINGSRWLNGWDTFLLSRAWDVLDAEHRLWIQWPIEEIGWIPPY